MALLSPNIYFPLASDTEGDVTLVKDDGNASAFPSDIADIGGTGHTYSGGFFHPSGDQGSPDFNSPAMRELVRLDNLTGGILVMMNLDTTTPIVGTDESIFSCGQTGSPEGGWGVDINSSNGVKLVYRAASGSLGTLISQVSSSGETTICFYIDLSQTYGQATVYLDGWVNKISEDMATDYPAQRDARAFSLFSRSNNDSGGVDRELNSGVGGDVGVSHLRIIRFEYDAYNFIQKAVRQYGADPTTLPAVLEGK